MISLNNFGSHIVEMILNKKCVCIFVINGREGYQKFIFLKVINFKHRVLKALAFSPSNLLAFFGGGSQRI